MGNDSILDDYEAPDVEAEQQAVATVRDELADVDGVYSVTLGLTMDDGDPAYAVWAYTDGTDADLDAAANSVDLPVQRRVTSETDAVGSGQQDLQERANPPTGGYEIGPNQHLDQSVGSFGLLGYEENAGSREENMRMLTAQHVFTGPDGTVFDRAYQPGSANEHNRIAHGRTLGPQTADVVAFHVEQDARDWRQVSEVAMVDGAVQGIGTVDPLMEVVTVGQETGRTEGVVRSSLGQFFIVEGTAGSEPVVLQGDSGSPVVTKPAAGENPQWLGIVTDRMTAFPNRFMAVKARFIYAQMDIRPF